MKDNVFERHISQVVHPFSYDELFIPESSTGK